MHTQIEAQLYEAAREDSEAESQSGSCEEEEEVNSDSDSDEETKGSSALTPETPPAGNGDLEPSLTLSVDLSTSVMHSSVMDTEVSL